MYSARASSYSTLFGGENGDEWMGKGKTRQTCALIEKVVFKNLKIGESTSETNGSTLENRIRLLEKL